MVKAVPLRCFFSHRESNFCAAGLSRKNKTAASEKAHLRWALPIVVPEVPERFPADALAHVMRRQYEAKSCTRGKRALSWMS